MAEPLFCGALGVRHVPPRARPPGYLASDVGQGLSGQRQDFAAGPVGRFTPPGGQRLHLDLRRRRRLQLKRGPGRLGRGWRGALPLAGAACQCEGAVGRWGRRWWSGSAAVDRGRLLLLQGGAPSLPCPSCVSHHHIITSPHFPFARSDDPAVRPPPLFFALVPPSARASRPLSAPSPSGPLPSLPCACPLLALRKRAQKTMARRRRWS